MGSDRAADRSVTLRHVVHGIIAVSPLAVTVKEEDDAIGYLGLHLSRKDENN
jgi:hypothetical protein